MFLCNRSINMTHTRILQAFPLHCIAWRHVSARFHTQPINFYGEIFDGLSRDVAVLSTFAWERWVRLCAPGRDPRAACRWAQRHRRNRMLPLEECRLVVLPVHLGDNHFAVLVARPREHGIGHADSLGPSSGLEAKALEVRTDDN